MNYQTHSGIIRANSSIIRANSGITCYAPTVFFLLLVSMGCGSQKPKQKAVKKPEKPLTEAEIRAKLPGAMAGKGWHIPWRRRDPDHPNRTLPVLIADARSGILNNSEEGSGVLLSNVRVKLFRKGLPAADIEAAQLTADQETRMVTGSGGVRLNSLTDPPDTVVTADRMDWDTRTNQIVAEGNVQITQKAQKNRPAFSNRGNRYTFDTTFTKFVGE